MTSNTSDKLSNLKSANPAVPERTKGRFPVKPSSTFQSVDMKDSIPLQRWSSSAGQEKTNNLPPLYRSTDPVMDDYMRPIPQKSAGELPARPFAPRFKRRWLFLIIFIVGMVCIIPAVVIATKHKDSPTPTQASLISTSSTTTVTKEIPATIVTHIVTELITVPMFSQTTIAPTITQSIGFPPLTTLTTRVTSTDLRNTVIPIPVPSAPPSTSTIVLSTTDTATVIANPPPTSKGMDGVARKVTICGRVYTTVTETVTHTITSTRTLGKWATETRNPRIIESAVVSPKPTTANLDRRGSFNWDWRVTSTLTETVHKTVTVTISKTMTNIVHVASDIPTPIPGPNADVVHRRVLPPNPIDLETCQIAYNGKPTSSERCHGLCNSGYCYAYWNIIPCDQWSCCQSCGCYNNSLTPAIAANASSRGMLDCRPAKPASMNATINTTTDNGIILTAY